MGALTLLTFKHVRGVDQNKLDVELVSIGSGVRIYHLLHILVLT